MSDRPNPINPEDFEDIEYDLHQNPLLCDNPYYPRKPLDDWNLDGILRYLGVEPGQISRVGGSDLYHDIYAFLVLAYHALETKDDYYLKPLHIILRYYDVEIFALSDLGLPITAELVKMGLKLPDQIDEALGERLRDVVGDTFDHLFTPEEYNKFKWYKIWSTFKFSSLKDYFKFYESRCELPEELNDLEIMTNILDQIYDRLGADASIKGSEDN